MDQVFVLKNLFEKYFQKGKGLYVAFVDLEKVHARVDRNALWKINKYMVWEESYRK